MSEKSSPLQATRKPATARRLQSTAHHLGGYWILADAEAGTVTICAQRKGEESTGTVTMPRAKFLRLLDWYQKPQELREVTP